EYLGLTGNVIHAADALSAGLADAFVPSNALAELAASLRPSTVASGDDVVAAIDAVTAEHRTACDAGASLLARQRDAIDAAFGAATVQEIVA
ncbi:enoyl-CoA hydratase/isomerase family protein, partial [Acinetobacter baumannii]